MSSSETIDATDETHWAETDDRQRTDTPTDRPKSVEDIREAYARYADWIDRFGWLDRLLTGRYRRRQFGDASGRILDVACGTGTNLRYLPESVEYVGIDVSEEMLERARAELDSLGRDGTLERMDAQALEYADDSFDTVISSFSTCTFPDRVAALREMQRVCAPDGRILLVEHGRSDVRVIARFQEWRAESQYEKAGCRATQEPLEVVRRAGLSVDEVETGQFGRITSIVSTDTETNGSSDEGR